jgi:hypothetical protein
MKHMIDLYRQNRFKVISERMIEVDRQIVTKQTKKGRVLFTCSCENSTTFANSQMCRHKQFFIVLPFLESMNNRLDYLISYYTVARNSYEQDETKKVCDFYISDLKELKTWKSQ